MRAQNERAAGGAGSPVAVGSRGTLRLFDNGTRPYVPHLIRAADMVVDSIAERLPGTLP